MPVLILGICCFLSATAEAKKHHRAPQHTAIAIQQKSPKTAVVLWYEADSRHLFAIEHVLETEVPHILREVPDMDLVPVVITESSPLFVEAKKAIYSEEPAETAEEANLVDRAIAEAAKSFLAARWPVP
jgi:hypothetical protein